jgi:predicted nucleic acid-binding protein
MRSGCSLAGARSIAGRTLNSEVQGILRRLKPEKRQARLAPRAESELEFIETTTDRPRKLLYDTTVYIDILQNRFPQNGDAMLRSSEAWHSPVTEAELAAAIGLLNPAQPETRGIIEQVIAVIERRPTYRTITPDSGLWRDAGILSGLLARLQGYGRDQRRRALSDALLFATARKHGCTVLTRNAVDFDLLGQLDPSGRVLFYKQKLPTTDPVL